MRTSIDQGGSWGYGWSNGSAPGVFLRGMMNSFNIAGPTVASVCRHPKLIKYYTDWHDVDEDLRTMFLRGGYWEMIDKVGVTQQNMYDTPDRVYASVASLKNKD